MGLSILKANLKRGEKCQMGHVKKNTGVEAGAGFKINIKIKMEITSTQYHLQLSLSWKSTYGGTGLR